MHAINTRRGPLAIADARGELDDWSLPECLAWLARNDPNGEWRSYMSDYGQAVQDYGELSVADARDACWDQMADS